MRPCSSGRGLRAIRGVRSARLNGSHGEWAKVTIDAERGAGDLREPIAVAAGRAGALVRELHADKPSLERLFLRIMETEETPGGGENREERR